jgi:hypothetical protein
MKKRLASRANDWTLARLKGDRLRSTIPVDGAGRTVLSYGSELCHSSAKFATCGDLRRS